jgi:LPXTG-motif cell wall-anchored protein
MRALIGSVVVALGVLLAIYGLDSTECLSARVSRAFHTYPTHNSLWFLAGGLLFVLVGLALAFRSRRQRV